MSEQPKKFTQLKFKGNKTKQVKAVKRSIQQVYTQQKADKEQVSVTDNKQDASLNVKTPAEQSFDLIRKKRLLQRVDKKMQTSYKDKLKKRNQILNNQPMHEDIFKIGEKIQKGY